MKEKHELVEVRREDIVSVLAVLDCFVVSLERIGASGVNDVDQLVIDFVKDWEVFHRLAECRRKLSECFSSKLGEDEMDELEREMKDVIYWSFEAREPPKKSDGGK